MDSILLEFISIFIERCVTGSVSGSPHNHLYCRHQHTNPPNTATPVATGDKSGGVCLSGPLYPPFHIVENV